MENHNFAPSAMTSKSIYEAAVQTLQLEAQSVLHLQAFINADFEKAVKLIAAGTGRLVVTGIGKSAIIAQKMVATFNSTGTPSLFMHAADAIHGDLGMIQEQDIVMMVSKSGETAEIKVLVPLIKRFGNRLIGMTGNLQSILAMQADVVINTSVEQEACPHNLAPTTSTTAQLAMGDAMAVSLMYLRGFEDDDFAKFHPGGALGKKLYLRVQDIFLQNQQPKVGPDAILREVIMEMTSKRLGATAVTDDHNKLLGIITDGDLRRMLEKHTIIGGIVAKDIMTVNPKTISPEALAVEALDVLRKYDINQLVVTNGDGYAGFLHLHDLVREGII